MKPIESMGELFTVVASTAKNHGANVQSWKPNGERADVELTGAFVGVLSVLQRLEVKGDRTRVTRIDVDIRGRAGEMTARCVVSLLASGQNVPETMTARRFESLAKAIPREAWLTRYRDDGGRITIEGQAASLEQVTDFVAGLKKSKQFDEVAIGRTQKKRERNGEEVVSFSLTAKAST